MIKIVNSKITVSRVGLGLKISRIISYQYGVRRLKMVFFFLFFLIEDLHKKTTTKSSTKSNTIIKN